MKVALISTVQLDEETRSRIKRALNPADEYLYIDTVPMKISHCIGCNECWLVHPGICTLKDDYHIVLETILQTDKTYFIGQGKNGFMGYQFKNIIDRILPLMTMYLRFKDGEMCHVARYNKKIRCGLIYQGVSDKDYLELWQRRFIKNLLGVNLGVHRLEDLR